VLLTGVLLTAASAAGRVAPCPSRGVQLAVTAS